MNIEFDEEHPNNFDYNQAIKELEESMKRVLILEGQIDTEVTYGNSLRTNIGKFVNCKREKK